MTIKSERGFAFGAIRPPVCDLSGPIKCYLSPAPHRGRYPNQNPMEIFDDTIKEIKRWLRERETEVSCRYVKASRREGHTSDPAGSSKNSSPRSPIILRADTQVELGHPTVGSCNAALATHDGSLVENGRISLLGPDIQETDKDQLPFAQIVLAGCSGDVVNTASAMERILHASAQSKAYMIRSVPNLIWSRVSKDGARSGFTLYGLGTKLINSLHLQCESIASVEVLFVTTSRDDVGALGQKVEIARKRLRQYRSYRPMPDGSYECESPLDCEDCEEQSVCDSIRDVIRLRKGDRLVSFVPE